MSKGNSGLFRGTSGAKANQSDRLTIDSRSNLNARTINAVTELIVNTPDSKKKAVAVGAYDVTTGRISVAFAGEIPKRVAQELRERAETVGGIGTHGLSGRNIVGVCAEFHVVNSLLLGGSKWKDIRLTPAIRPRTGQMIPFCENCKTMFHDIIEKERFTI